MSRRQEILNSTGRNANCYGLTVKQIRDLLKHYKLEDPTQGQKRPRKKNLCPKLLTVAKAGSQHKLKSKSLKSKSKKATKVKLAKGSKSAKSKKSKKSKTGSQKNEDAEYEQLLEDFQLKPRRKRSNKTL